MDKEMIERMAKAIFTKRYQAPGTYKDLEWEKFSAKEVYLEDARQAALAMREPTDEMMVAMETAEPQLECFLEKEKSPSYLVWVAAIDAITGVK